MTYIRRLILALALSAGLAPAFAQVAPPVPALPDTERRTSYSISASTCACNVGFALYGDSTDVGNWIEVFVNGVLMTQSGNWTLSSATGTIGSIPLPITNAVLTFTAPQTGTIQIVGARRPRRTSQFNEGAGIPTRNMNVVISDLTAQNREIWDKTNDVTGRALMSQPGNTLSLLPLPSACQGKFLGFDATGLIPQCNAGGAGSGNVVGPVSSTAGNIALWNNATGTLLRDAGFSLSGIDTNVSTSKTANYTAANADCGAPLLLGGNALFTLTINAANTYTANCQIILINTDVYTGVGSGRGKIIAANGITNFVLYPGQQQKFRRNGSSWVPDPGPLASSFGPVWSAPATVNFFTDTGGSDSLNDGLAAGASGAFQTLNKCATQAYSVVYTRNLGGVICSNTAGQTQQAFLQIFYQLNAGGTLLFNSATPGSPWTWKPINSGYALQFGDNALVGLTDITMSSAGVTTPSGFITAHQFSVLDINTGFSFTPTVSVSTGINCDYDAHFNINNGITVNAGTFSTDIFDGCQNSSWNFNGTQTFVGTPAFGRYAVFKSGTTATFNGNVVFSGATSGSAAFISDNSVIMNLSGSTLQGGAPVLASGGLLCTAVGVCTPTPTATIASGAKALATGAITSATCTSAQTDTATGTATTDTLTASFNGDPTAVTGYIPSTAGMLTIIAYPTANTANFKVCNNTASSITPGAITLNWRVVR